MGIKQAFFGYSVNTFINFCPAFNANLFLNNSDNNSRQPIDVPGTVRKWRIVLSTAPGGVTSRTFTFQVNGSATSLSITISGAATTGSDLVNSLSLSAGDVVTIRQTASGTPAATRLASVFEFEPTTADVSMYAVAGDQTALGTGTQYADVMGYGGTWLSAGQGRVVSPIAGTMTGYRMRLAVAPGGVTARTFTILLNGVDQDGTGGTPDTRITITGAAQTGTATFSLTVAATDTLELKAVSTGATAVSRALGTSTFLASTAGQWAITFAETSVTGGGTFHQPTGNAQLAWNATEGNVQYLGPETPITLANLYGRMITAPGAGNTRTYTLRVNGADSAQAITASGTGTTFGPSAGAAVTLVSTDLWCFSHNQTGTPAQTSPRLTFLGTSGTLPQAAYLLVSP